jgi:predicted O-methyltransferase YrrM
MNFQVKVQYLLFRNYYKIHLLVRYFLLDNLHKLYDQNYEFVLLDKQCIQYYQAVEQYLPLRKYYTIH